MQRDRKISQKRKKISQKINRFTLETSDSLSLGIDLCHHSNKNTSRQVFTESFALPQWIALTRVTLLFLKGFLILRLKQTEGCCAQYRRGSEMVHHCPLGAMECGGPVGYCR